MAGDTQPRFISSSMARPGRVAELIHIFITMCFSLCAFEGV